MRIRSVAAIAALALVALTPGAVAAQGPEPIDAPPGFAEVRARFEGKTANELRAMGYVPEPPVCVSHPELGGMGVHAANFQLHGQQFGSGTMDPDQPPIVLLSADLEQVIGLEWEAKDLGQGEMELFGQPVVLQPGHDGPPGTELPHYMLHAYFRPAGQVLFAPFDPDVRCDLPDTAVAGHGGDDGSAPLGGIGLLVAVILAAATIRGWASRVERSGRSA